MFAPDYGVNISRVNIPADIASSFRCGVPNLSTLMGVMVNDRFTPTATLINNLPAGVTMCSLTEAAEKYPAIVERAYGSAASLTRPGTALNTLLAQDGVFTSTGGCALKKRCSL